MLNSYKPVIKQVLHFYVFHSKPHVKLLEASFQRLFRTRTMVYKISQMKFGPRTRASWASEREHAQLKLDIIFFKPRYQVLSLFDGIYCISRLPIYLILNIFAQSLDIQYERREKQFKTSRRDFLWAQISSDLLK